MENIKNKKILILIALGLVFAAIVYFGFADKNKEPNNAGTGSPKERTKEEVLKDLTAPSKTGETPAPVSKEIIDSLTAPSKNSSQPSSTPIPESVVNSLSAPAK